jgi:hypothetical protein
MGPDWDRVFDLRCRSKRGERLSDEDLEYLEYAHEVDRDRYASLNARVFNETAPIGSLRRVPEG